MKDPAGGDRSEETIRYLGMTLRRRTYIWLQVFSLGFCAGGAILCLILRWSYNAAWLLYVALAFGVLLVAEIGETLFVLRGKRR